MHKVVIVWSSLALERYRDLEVKPDCNWETGRRVYTELNAFFSGTVLSLSGVVIGERCRELATSPQTLASRTLRVGFDRLVARVFPSRSINTDKEQCALRALSALGPPTTRRPIVYRISPGASSVLGPDPDHTAVHLRAWQCWDPGFASLFRPSRPASSWSSVYKSTIERVIVLLIRFCMALKPRLTFAKMSGGFRLVA